MQVYAELRILTARPSVAEEARVPHRLYGHVPAAVVGTAALWRGQALEAIAAARASRPRAHRLRRHRPLFRGADPGA